MRPGSRGSRDRDRCARACPARCVPGATMRSPSSSRLRPSSTIVAESPPGSPFVRSLPGRTSSMATRVEAIRVADLVLASSEREDLVALTADTLITKGTSLAEVGRVLEGTGRHPGRASTSRNAAAGRRSRCADVSTSAISSPSAIPRQADGDREGRLRGRPAARHPRPPGHAPRRTRPSRPSGSASGTGRSRPSSRSWPRSSNSRTGRRWAASCLDDPGPARRDDGSGAWRPRGSARGRCSDRQIERHQAPPTLQADVGGGPVGRHRASMPRARLARSDQRGPRYLFLAGRVAIWRRDSAALSASSTCTRAWASTVEAMSAERVDDARGRSPRSRAARRTLTWAIARRSIHGATSALIGTRR